MMNMFTKSNHQQKDSLLPFFLLTFLITWGLGALAIFLPAQLQALVGELTDTSPIYFLAIAAPTISATILTFSRDSWSGLKSLYARLIHWRFGIQWYALILIGIPVLGWIVTRFTESNPLKETEDLAQLLLMLFYVLVTGPLCEELGWRGYALPRLLKSFNPFAASLILGAIWGVWHLPSFFLGGMVQAGLSLPLFLLNALLLSIFVTWVFQRTGGSVLITVLIHFTVNICASIIGVAVPVFVVLFLTVDIFILVIDKQFGWFRPMDFDHRFISIGEAK
jgi:membrane protease YdiL (CAAX protease family)